MVRQYFYSGSNLQYICEALQKQAITSVSIGASTLTNITVATNVATATTVSAHQLYKGARVTVSGATVDTDLNGTYTILTVPSSTTYTFTTAAVADATYTDSGLTVSTNWPLLSLAKWSIKVFTYTGTLVDGIYDANSTTSPSLACSNRASY